jgi:hypothetical protein
MKNAETVGKRVRDTGDALSGGRRPSSPRRPSATLGQSSGLRGGQTDVCGIRSRAPGNQPSPPDGVQVPFEAACLANNERRVR